MTVHKRYTIGGKEYHARNNIDDGPRETPYPKHYAISCEVGDTIEWIGRVHNWTLRGFWVVGWDGLDSQQGWAPEGCKTLKEAVTALVLELERRAARRKESKVNWGDVIVPRIFGTASMLIVEDAGRPHSECVGMVTEIASG